MKALNPHAKKVEHIHFKYLLNTFLMLILKTTRKNKNISDLILVLQSNDFFLQTN
jgi:hypothetical protein